VAEPLPEFVFRKNAVPAWIWDPGTMAILDVNEAAVERYGYARDDHAGAGVGTRVEVSVPCAGGRADD
jgi:PAS domain-containing protein